MAIMIPDSVNIRTGSLMFCLTWICAGCAAEKPQETDFHKGRKLVVRGKHKEALVVLKKYQREHPQGKQASRAGLFLGKAYLALAQFDDAEKAFQATVDNFPNTPEGHKCRYKLAVLAFLKGNEREALRKFRALSDAPDGPLAAEAKAFGDYLAAKPHPAGQNQEEPR